MSHRAVAVIPARYASTRLPGKPLLDETGLPLICHVVRQVEQASRIVSVLVATDDERIARVVREHGGTAVMTRADHPNGTSRIAEVAAGLPAGIDLIVNVQGDEPEIEPDLIDDLVDRLAASDEPMATVAAPFPAEASPENPNMVKVVLNQRGQAMYFSRSAIPFDRDGAGGRPLLHLGIYAYRRDFLPRYIQLSPTPAEELEKLEQLRVIEHGYPIGVVLATHAHHGIDTPDQYAAFVQRFAATRD